MLNLSQHLDRLTDKMKTKINSKIDKIGHNTKFETLTFKKSDKNSYWENNEKPKKKKTTAEVILSFVLSIFIGLIIISFVLFFNANFIFLLKIASSTFYNKAFPSNCNEPPFGTKSSNICDVNTKWTKQDAIAINTILERNEVSKGGGESESSTCKKPGAGFPYSFLNKNSSGIVDEYANWFLTSLANTDMKLNLYIKDILENKKFKNVPNEIMILIGTLILTLLPIVGIFTFGSLIYNQIKLLFSQSFVTIILICLTCLIVIGANCIITTFNIMKTWFSLVIYPAIADNWENWPAIKKIISDEKIIIGYFLGLIFIISLLSTPLNKNYSAPVKGVTTGVYVLLIIIHLFIYLHNLWKLPSTGIKTCKI